MAERENRLTICLSDELDNFLEEESIELHVPKSHIVVQELYKRMRKKKNLLNEQIAFAFLLTVIGVTLWFFTMVLLPKSDDGGFNFLFSAFLSIGLISIVSGYVGFFLIYKRKRIVKI